MDENLKNKLLEHDEYNETEYDLDKYDLYEYLERELNKSSKKPKCENLKIKILGQKRIKGKKYFKIKVENEYIIFLKRTKVSEKYHWKIKESYQKLW